jgi:HK97 family phage prohead protease
MFYEYKSIKAEIKDVDQAQGIVTGYFSVFDSKDADNDVIVKGAFERSLNNNGTRIKHLWQHDVRFPLSKPSVLIEDNKGLYFESKVSKTSYGKDVLQLYQDGVVDEHSIGFRTVKSANKKDYTELQEVKIFEGSTVTFGANEHAKFTGMKGMTSEDIISKMDSVYKSLKNGSFENEEIFENLEIYFNQLKQYLTEVTQPAQKALDPNKDELLTLKEEIQLLTIKHFYNGN